MAYNLNWNVNVGAQIDSQPYGVGKASSIQVTSSNAIQATQTVTGSNFSPVSAGQLTNVIGATFYNDNAVFSSSVIIIAVNGSTLTTIGPGVASAIAWSGSMGPISASATTGQTASLQYYLQQS